MILKSMSDKRISSHLRIRASRETRVEERGESCPACNPLVTLGIERVGGRKSGAAKRNEIAMPRLSYFLTINPSATLDLIS